MDRIVIARNPRARHDYHLLETWEAGLVLTGPEVKSLRSKKASLGEAYAHVRGGEVWIEGLTISPYEHGSYNNPPPVRSRKLLLHQRQVKQLLGATTQKGLTVVPLRLYISDKGRAKVELGLAKGKQLHDRRRDIAERQSKREVERELADATRGRR